MTSNFPLDDCSILERLRLLIHLQRTLVWGQNGLVLWQRLSQSYIQSGILALVYI